MYTHTITERNFYNIYYITYIYICTNFNFVIYGISMKLLFICNYAHANLENVFCNSILIYVIYIMQYKLVEYI